MSHYGPPKGSKTASAGHYGPPSGKGSYYGPPRGDAVPADLYNPPTSSSELMNARDAAIAEAKMNKPSRFSALKQPPPEMSTAKRTEPETPEPEGQPSKKRKSRFEGVFDPRNSAESKVMLPQAEHPDIDFLGGIFGEKDEKKAELEQKTGAKLSFKVSLEEDPHISIRGFPC